MIQLLLKRASLSHPFRQWDAHDYDVLADGEVIGRILKASVLLPILYLKGVSTGDFEDALIAMLRQCPCSGASLAEALSRFRLRIGRRATLQKLSEELGCDETR
jgi:hypothetical protein